MDYALQGGALFLSLNFLTNDMNIINLTILDKASSFYISLIYYYLVSGILSLKFLVIHGCDKAVLASYLYTYDLLHNLQIKSMNNLR